MVKSEGAELLMYVTDCEPDRNKIMPSAVGLRRVAYFAAASACISPKVLPSVSLQ